MEKKNIVITSGADRFAIELACCLKKAGANVMLADDPSQELDVAAEIAGAAPLEVIAHSHEKWIKLIDRIYRRCGRLDCWIFHWPAASGGDPWTPMPACNSLWQERVLLQMYISRCLLGRMGQSGGGHIVTAVPWAGLYAPFVLRDYWIDQHAGLHFSEKLAALGRAGNINISARCIGTPLPDKVIMNRRAFASLLRRRAEFVIKGIQRNLFLIDDSYVAGSSSRPAAGLTIIRND